MAVAALVLSILALIGSILSFLPIVGYLAVPFAIIAIILGAVAMKKQPEKKGMAVAALVMGIIALVLGSILLIACVVCVSCAAGAVDGVVDAVNGAFIPALLM